MSAVGVKADIDQPLTNLDPSCHEGGKSVLPGLLGPASLPSLATAVQHGRHTGKAMDISDDELAAISGRAKQLYKEIPSSRTLSPTGKAVLSSEARLDTLGFESDSNRRRPAAE